MKRFALKAVLFLVLGVILNVAVAWGCAAWSRVTTGGWALSRMTWEPEERWVMAEEWRGVGIVRLELGGFYMRRLDSINTRDLPHWSKLGKQTAEAISDSRTRVITRRTDMACGLPCIALCSFITNSPLLVHGIDMSSAISGTRPLGRILPLQIIWPGFAINTIFYAAILWLPFAAFGRIRRRRRITRGLCPKCGYDLRGRGDNQNLCPECGANASNQS